MNLLELLNQSKEIVTGVGVIAVALLFAIITQFIAIKSTHKI